MFLALPLVTTKPTAVFKSGTKFLVASPVDVVNSAVLIRPQRPLHLLDRGAPSFSPSSFLIELLFCFRCKSLVLLQ
ncbi:hypothetical protein TIFTF001_045115 [Ficus carica]|uniref:Uncharacterized protein n=1 Tax=Ficus carica TaxID=3494 RepID=A0AA88CJP5_FICCA|nr:hypothetical protein TIFTF001_045115 [Ficus carica]